MTEASLALAERALAAVPSAVEAQATVIAERSLMLRFARSRPTQATAVDDLTVAVAAVRNGHVGTADTNATDAGSLGATARAAVTAAEVAAASSAPGGYPGLPRPDPPRGAGGHDADTARLDPATGGKALAAAFAETGEELEAHGIWTAGEVETALASSTGHSAVDRVTDAFMKVIAVAPDGRSGYAADTAVAARSIDPGDLARTAARKASARGEQARLEPGDYPVVLEHHAVGELLAWLGRLALNGLAYAEGRSALSGGLERRVAAPCVNLADSPRYPATLPRAFDAEGVGKAPLPMIQDGVARAVAHDTRSAALCAGQTTGHALAPGGAPEGAVPTNLVLAGGGAADGAALARPIERGVYVTRLWYVNPVRPKETVVTGVTRDGTFLIEDGQPTLPLADMRLTDSVLGILGRVEELSVSPRLVSDGEFYGRRFATGVVCPALRAGSVRFTG